MKYQVILSNPDGVSEKITLGTTVGSGINDGIGTYFPDGAPIVTIITGVTSALSTKNTAYELTHSIADEDALKAATETFDTTMNNDVVLYVQGKVNAVTTLVAAEAIAHAAGMKIKAKGEKQPVPAMVATADAVYSNIPNTVLITLKKAPKYTKWLEVWITTTPNDESSWKLKDTFAGRRCLVDALESGENYYFRLKACNSNGKSTPSNPIDQRAA